MANPSGDVYEDIAELYRIVEGLASAARVPNVSQIIAKMQFSQNITGVAGTRTATGWGDMDPGGMGYPVAPSGQVLAGPSGRLLVMYGMQAGVWTTTAGGNNERAGIGAEVNSGSGFGALAHSTSSDAPAMLQVDQASEQHRASIFGMKVCAGAIPNTMFYVTTRFYRHNASSFGVEYINPWLLLLPL
jgi:hypothetical protein